MAIGDRFVLDLVDTFGYFPEIHVKASRAAIVEYARHIKEYNPVLAGEIFDTYLKETPSKAQRGTPTEEALDEEWVSDNPDGC